MEFEALKQAIVDVLNVYPDEIHEETTFMEDLGADSLDLYQVVMELEDKLSIELDPEEVQNIKTVGEALEILKRHSTQATEE